MEGFTKIAIVNLLEDFTKKDYGFALYDAEYQKIQKNNYHYVVVNPRGKNRIVGIIKNILPIEEYDNKVTAQVIGVVDMSDYEKRIEEENRIKEIEKRKATIEKELERELNKSKTVDYYEKMVKEYPDNLKLKELVEELKEITETERE